MADLRGGSTVGGRPILGKEARDNYIGMIVGNKIKESLFYQSGSNITLDGTLDIVNHLTTKSLEAGNSYLQVGIDYVYINGYEAVHEGNFANFGNLLSNQYLAKTANAVSASKLATPRTITLSGDLSGASSFDGSTNITLTATVLDDSHSHVIANIDGLQTALDSKVNSSLVNINSVGDTIPVRDRNGNLTIKTALTFANGEIYANGTSFTYYDGSNPRTIWHSGNFDPNSKNEDRQGLSYQNGWGNYTSGYTYGAYWKDKNGVVHLTGLLTIGNSGNSVVIANLPVGYRPANREIHSGMISTGVTRIDVDANGNIMTYSTLSAGWLSIAGISFKAEN